MSIEVTHPHGSQFSLHFAECMSQLQGRLLKSSRPVQYYSDIAPRYNQFEPGELFILIEPMLQLSNTRGIVAILWGDQVVSANVEIDQLQLVDLEDGTI